MSTPTTGASLSLLEATTIAESFMGHFDQTRFEHWFVAGSVRRSAPTVGDIEHVIVERTLMEAAPGEIWPSERPGVRSRLDDLVASGVMSRHVLPDGTQRWGDKYRAVVWGGAKHDLFFATEDNLGAILAIRTGPKDFSRELMTRLRQRGRRMIDGQVWRLNEVGIGDEVIPCPSEEKFFELCGVPWLEPAKRGGA